VPTTPDDLILPPAEALREAERLLAAGRPFHAHEVLEAAWKAAPDDERDLWQGLAQLAVGLTHARRGNTTGAARLLLRAADRIEPYAPAEPYGVPVAALTTWARDLATGERLGEDVAAPSLTGGVA
jgi:predicted metal-dependent hydrolase